MKVNHSVSLFTQALRGSTSHTDYRMLNSTRRTNILPRKLQEDPLFDFKDFDPKFQPRVERITYQRPLTKAVFSIELQYLESIERQDIINWRKKFLGAVETCGWSDEYALDYLLALTDTHIRKIIENETDYITAINILIRKKYPISHAENFNRRLALLQQNDFHDVEDYMKSINAILNRWGASAGATEEQMNAKREACFLQGLSIETRNFMDVHNIQNTAMIYKRIHDTEINIKARMHEQITSSNFIESEPYYKRSFKPRVETRHFRKPQYVSNTKGKPYCKYHKTHTHSTEECQTLKRKEKRNEKYNKNASNNNEHSYALLEQPIDLKKLEIPVALSDLTLNAFIDTGSSKSLIDRDTAEELRQKIIRIEPLTISTADNTIHNITEMIKTTLRFKEKQTEIKTNLYLLKSLTPKLIIGLDTLTNNDFTCDLKAGLISFNRVYFTIHNFKNPNNTFDTQLIENTHVCPVNTTQLTQEKCLKRIQKFKLLNPTLGTINEFQHTITLTETKIVSQASYKIPLSKREETNEEIERLLDFQIIQPSQSQYSSPAFPIYKKNGRVRLVVDYRELNKLTTTLRPTLPKINDILRELGNSTMFSQVDLSLGYYQILMDKTSIKYTAFNLLGKHWEFLRMPFGLKNAPYTFQNAMLSIFGDLPFCKIYLDDILIHSVTENEHFNHIISFLERASSHGLSINFEKSVFLKYEVTYLGHKINSRGYRIDSSRLPRFQNLIPKNKKEVSKVLGIVQWYRDGLPNASQKVSFLTHLLRKKTAFTWTQENTEKLRKLFSEIQSEKVLGHPNFHEPFDLFTDASETGAGGVLQQNGNIIGFFSYQWSTSERNYTIVEKETAAILKAAIHFKSIIFGTEVRIHTDNRNSLFSKTITKRSQRWKILLEQLGAELKFVSGKENVAADQFSRVLTLFETDDVLISYEELELEQKTCPFVTENKVRQITLKVKTKFYKLAIDKKDRIIIPNNMKRNFILRLHETLVHPGSHGLYITLKRNFYLLNLKEMCIEIAHNYLLCQRNKTFKDVYGKQQNSIEADEFLDLVTTDICGPIPTRFFKNESEQGKFWIIVFTDIATKWTECYILYSITVTDVVSTLKTFIKEIGKPSRLHSDRGTQYTGSALAKLCNTLKTRQSFTSPYHPQGNGVTERQNGIIGSVLRCSKNTQITDLPKLISKRINLVNSRVTGMSPFEMRFGFSPLVPQITLSETDISAAANKGKQRRVLDKRKFNSGRIETIHKVGDLVFLKNKAISKMEPKWLGPGEIIKCGGSGQYELNVENIIYTGSYRDIRPWKKREEQNVVTY